MTKLGKEKEEATRVPPKGLEKNFGRLIDVFSHFFLGLVHGDDLLLFVVYEF